MDQRLDVKSIIIFSQTLMLSMFVVAMFMLDNSGEWQQDLKEHSADIARDRVTHSAVQEALTTICVENGLKTAPRVKEYIVPSPFPDPPVPFWRKDRQEKD